jgi:hypothetical protein
VGSADSRATQREFVRGWVTLRPGPGATFAAHRYRFSAPVRWLAWPSISWLKLAGTDVQRWQKAYPTVLQVRRAAQVIACGALVDVRVVEVVASIGGVMACRRI